jgi:hypothetical protein
MLFRSARGALKQIIFQCDNQGRKNKGGRQIFDEKSEFTT